MKTCKCFSCGGEYPDIKGPVHRYMKSSPGCWSVFGEVLAREYSSPEYFQVHRLTVDAYAVQHPGSTDRQSVHSVGVHLIRLCLFLEHGLSAENANDAMLEAAKNKNNFTYLEPPSFLGEITVADIVCATDVSEHILLVNRWAQCVWDAWSIHQNTIRSWLPDLYFGSSSPLAQRG